MTQEWLHKGSTQASKFPAPPKLRSHQQDIAEYLGSVIAWAGEVLKMSQNQPKRLKDDPERPGEHWEIPGEQWIAGEATRTAGRLLDMLNSNRTAVMAQYPIRLRTINANLVSMTLELERILNAWRTSASAAHREGKRSESASTSCIRLALDSGCQNKDKVINWCRDYGTSDDYEIEIDEANECITFWPTDGRLQSTIKWKNIPRYIHRIRDNSQRGQ